MQQVPNRRQCVKEARQVAETCLLHKPMDLCAHVSEERGNGEGAGLQELSLLSDTRRYISLADNQRLDIFADSVQWELRRFYLL